MILADTNILLWLAQREAPDYPAIKAALQQIRNLRDAQKGVTQWELTMLF